MINGYEIKKQNNEEILYIYFDLDNEFAKVNFKNQKEKLETIIKDFIKENRIAFTGTTVALIVGGTIIGNIVLNNNKKENITNENNIVYEEKINIKHIDTVEEIAESIKKEDIKEITNEKISEEVKPKIQNKTNLGKEESNNAKTKIVYQDNSTSNNKTNTSNEIDINDKNETIINIEEPKDSKIYVKVKRSNGEILNIELEEYIIGVVGAEMPAAFNEQALMAQAIIARTYALKINSKGQTLTDNESTQSYKNNDELKSMWGNNYNTYYNKIKNSVKSTEGMYLTYNGTYIEAVYHSTSNGMTEDASNVWGNSFPYLVSVESTYDSLNPSFLSEKIISYQELSLKLAGEINIDTNFNILSKTSGNRVDKIEVNGNVYSGVQFRNLLGLRSADFDIEKLDTGIKLTTRGYGHGVGMSQYGANGMAKAGYNYKDILKHYYRGVTINQI